MSSFRKDPSALRATFRDEATMGSDCDRNKGGVKVESLEEHEGIVYVLRATHQSM